MKKKNCVITLIFIIILGTFLRLYGIKWGLTTDRYFHGHSYHPDEQLVLESLRGMNPSKLDFKPRGVTMWSKGTLVVYTTGIAIKLGSILNLLEYKNDYSFYKENPLELAKLYLAGRLVSVLFGILSIVLLFIITKKYFNQSTGLLTSFIFAIVPVHVVNCHYLSTDAMMCFWVLIVFFLSLKILESDKIVLYILSGLFVGISAATKYNSSITLILPISAHIIKEIDKRNFNFFRLFKINILITICSALLGFIIVNPYSIISFSDFKNGLLFSADVLTRPMVTPDTFPNQPTILFYITNALIFGTGPLLFMLFIAGIIYSLVRLDKKQLIIFIWLLVWLIILSQTNWKLLRWTIPMIPFLCILSAKLIIDILNIAKRTYKILTIVIVIFIFVNTILYSFAYVKLMSEKDVRDISSEWIEKNIPANSKIGLPVLTFAWDAGILQMLCWYNKTEPFFKNITLYNLVILDESVEKLKLLKPDYIIFSDFYSYPLIIENRRYHEHNKLEFLTAVINYYNLIMKVEKKPKKYGFYPVASFYPHDWRYVCPSIYIYKRK